LLYTKWRDPGDEPKLILFGQLKRIVKQWLGSCLICKGGTYPAQLMYQELADMACNRITAAITRKFLGERPIKALLDPYNHTGSTRHLRFNTSRADRWETNGPPPKNQVNWVILDSDWEAEFCRVAEAHPKVIAYTKNHNLGLEVPYRYGSENRKYLPDFIVRVDDGHGQDDLLNLIVEIKGYRREDAKDKKTTMDTYWVPDVNHLGSYGRWAFDEFGDIYEIGTDFGARVEAEFAKLVEKASGRVFTPFTLARNRSEASVRKQFGPQPQILRFTHELWKRVAEDADRSIRLSDIQIAAAESACDPNDALAVLGLLSSHSVRLLDMQMRSSEGSQVSQEEFVRNLANWWRRKTMSDGEWKRWASSVEVKWVPNEASGVSA
jgi:hypothetical protein